MKECAHHALLLSSTDWDTALCLCLLQDGRERAMQTETDALKIKQLENNLSMLPRTLWDLNSQGRA